MTIQNMAVGCNKLTIVVEKTIIYLMTSCISLDLFSVYEDKVWNLQPRNKMSDV